MVPLSFLPFRIQAFREWQERRKIKRLPEGTQKKTLVATQSATHAFKAADSKMRQMIAARISSGQGPGGVELTDQEAQQLADQVITGLSDAPSHAVGQVLERLVRRLHLCIDIEGLSRQERRLAEWSGEIDNYGLYLDSIQGFELVGNHRTWFIPFSAIMSIPYWGAQIDTQTIVSAILQTYVHVQSRRIKDL